MFKDFISELGQSVYCTEIYDFLELNKSQYSRFIKSKILNNEFAEEGKDYLTLLSSENSNKRGQFRQEYILHIDFAKKLCMVSKSQKGEDIRNYLVQLTKKIESAGLLNSKQIIEVIRLVKIFAVYEFRKEATKRNLQTFETNFTGDKRFLYSEFHKWRNEILHLGKEELNKMVLDYYIAEGKAKPKYTNKDSLSHFLNEYENIKIAFWDLLSSQNESEELINNICNLAGEIANEIKPFFVRLNETTLFHKKIENVQLKLGK